MKIVITTQYRENYGAHDWDGQGECPQSWRNKGGEFYVIENLTLDQANVFMENGIQDLYKLIEYKNIGAQEYVVSTQGYDDNETVVEEWETITSIQVAENGFVATVVTKNDEYGYMHKHIVEKRESFTMKEEGNRENYRVEFLLKDGQVVNSNNICNHLK